MTPEQSKEFNDILGEVALLLPKRMREALQSGVPDAATMNSIRQFLKDNNIQTTPTANPELLQLAKDSLPFQNQHVG